MDAYKFAFAQLNYFCSIQLMYNDNTWQRLEPLGIDTECLGGGRILHEPDKKHIRVYGYSQVQIIALIFICMTIIEWVTHLSSNFTKIN